MMKGMTVLKYLIKSGKEFHAGYNFNYQKPATCPYCGTSTDAILANKSNFSLDGKAMITSSCKCTACNKTFFFACVSDGNGNAPNVCLYPDVTFVPYQNDILKSISERFIDMYNQALQSEFVGNIDLAAIGYRSALEILVKDFAINELGKDTEEVSKKKLCAAIGEYLNQDDLVKTADVIRILGNDYTHYKRKYPDQDFKLLKAYMEIFLKQIEVQYMIKHPPVSRTL